MKHVAAVILAAGKGTRMRSELPKVLHEVCGVPLVQHVVNQVKSMGIKKIVVVVGYKKELVIEALRNENVSFVEQEIQKGTGHALLMTNKALRGFSGDILALDGDVFFEKKELLKKFYRFHQKNGFSMSIMTTTLARPLGYGRIIRNSYGDVIAIREDVDATSAEKEITEINAGIYIFDSSGLFPLLKKIKTNNRKKEYYITDAVSLYETARRRVGGFNIVDKGVVLGVNNRAELSELQRILKQKIIQHHQRNGVTILEPENTYIEDNVKIGNDTIVYPYTYIERGTSIGRNCRIGPFCKIRFGCSIKDKSVIGSFVEIVRSRVGMNTNIKHLAYIGDASVGNNVNIGAGTITANYDGVRKSKTKIEDGALIGADTVLVAPVTIGKRARTGAGSVVTRGKNVSAGKTVLGVPAREQKK